MKHALPSRIFTLVVEGKGCRQVKKWLLYGRCLCRAVSFKDEGKVGPEPDATVWT